MTPEQLKASILQRAMEGKLVPQDPNDEPASELLKRIKAEKEKLIKEGKIKRDKNETEIFRGDDGLHYEKFQDGSFKQVDVPYDIPESWEWARLNQVTNFGNFQSVKGNEIPDNAWVLDMEDIEKLSGILLKKVRKNGANDYKSNKYIFNKNTILYGKLRPYLKKVIISDEAGYCTTELFPINVMNGIEVSFFRFILISPYFSELVNQSVYGVKMPRVGTDFFKSMLVPIPPLNEQVKIKRRIELAVSKVDYYHELFNTLRQLNNSFPEKLRKSILQYAMQGKLVPQDVTDEPVEVLLEKIREEKQRLFEEGKLKKKDLQESIIYQGDDNSYYENIFPKNWIITKLCNLGYISTGNTPSKNKQSYWRNGTIPFFKPADLVQQKNMHKASEYLSIEGFKKARHVEKDSILVNGIGNIGVTGMVKTEGAFNQQMHSVKPYDYIDPDFLFYFFNTHFVQEQMMNNTSSTTIPILNKKKFSEIIVAFPSLREQKRIVHSISQLLKIISELNL